MKNRALALSIIFLLALSSISFIVAVTPVAAAGTGQWITKYTIADANTGEILIDRNFNPNTISGSGAILNDANLKITVTIKIGVNNPSAQLTLSTDLTKMAGKDHFWEQVGSSYKLGSGYNPNSASFTFNENSGTLTMICYGKAHEDGATVKVSNDVTLHKMVTINLITLRDPSKAVLDSVSPKLGDHTVLDFNNLLKQRQDTLAGYKSSGVDAGFIDIYSKVLSQAQAAANDGLADSAIDMLNSLNVAAPPTGSAIVGLIVVIAVFAVIAVLFALMFFRNRGKVGYIRMMVEDQIKDLEGVSMRAQRIDRNLAANLASIKERLKNSIGGEEESEEYNPGGYRQ
jgi:hypothetical protein